MAYGSCEWCGNSEEECECEDLLHRAPRVYPRMDQSFGTRILPVGELVHTQDEIEDTIRRVVRR